MKKTLDQLYNEVQAMETTKTRSFLIHSYNDKKENVLKIITVDKFQNIYN